MPKKTEKLDFIAGDFVVYPAHGVGQIEGVEVQVISGMEVTLYTISFEKDRMRLKLPVTKVKISGLRKLSSKDRLKDALATLQGRSQVRRIMWSRRAQEYETKINSGDPVSIAEVLRDLKRSNDDTEQSYSERQIYQSALERLAREVAAVDDITEIKATEKLEDLMGKVSASPANNEEADCNDADDEEKAKAA
ncbi:MAG: CarD family transcriptional regulator [Alphaproteobacteria bacterium]|nr:CarD family transcriptional regulator [Alphaproteobacteria bacterium]